MRRAQVAEGNERKRNPKQPVLSFLPCRQKNWAFKVYWRPS